MITYAKFEFYAPRSELFFFPKFSTGTQALQCKIWVGKHTFFLLLRPVLNSPDRDVFKNGFKS